MRSILFGLATLGLLVAPARTHAACAPTGVDAASVAAGREAIDADCPCAAATSKGAYRKCAADVVRARVDAETLSRACRRDVLAHAKLSICGQPGAAVCCRVGNGRARHRVVRDAARCVDTATLTSCVSSGQSVPSGCDASGCVPPTTTSTSTSSSTSSTTSTSMPPLCGNYILDAGEECDPPDGVTCDATCHGIPCPTVDPACGNGTIDPGEACEPPGTATCRADCQPAACAPAGPGEVTIACDVDRRGVGVGGNGTGYLVAWNATYQRRVSDILVRRLDVDAAPTDPQPQVATGDVPCGESHSSPSVASDGADYYAAWTSAGSVGGAGTQHVFGRPLGATSGTGPLRELASNVVFGSCYSLLRGPTPAAGVSPDRFAVGWDISANCAGQEFYHDPAGVVADTDPMVPAQPVGLQLFTGPPPGAFSASFVSVGALGGDALWAWHGIYAATTTPPFDQFIAAVWTDAAGSTSPFILTSRAEVVVTSPSVAGGAASFLVAWAQGAPPSGATITEIRGVRATRSSGRLDPDGGLLLATAATQITAGPVTAFDGTRWLVVWAEASGASNDLRAIAVAADGSVVDASPRLVASDVQSGGFAAASAVDGRVLVVFNRSEGATFSVRATLVTP